MRESDKEEVGPAELWDMKRDFQLGFMKQVGLQPEHRLLDIGCGLLRGGIPLIQYLDKKRYFGFDCRHDVVEIGRREAFDLGLQGSKDPTVFTTEHIYCMGFKYKFEYMLAFSVLIHMNDHLAGQCINLAKRYLTKDGSFYANVNIDNGVKSHWKDFPVVSRSMSFYLGLCEANDLLLEDIGALKDFGHISGNKIQDNQRALKIYRK